MATLAIAAPCLPGGADVLRSIAHEVRGSRRMEYEQFHQRVGIAAERWYIQQTPQGDFNVTYLEGENPARSIGTLAASDHPFDRWFKQQVKLVHGIDFNEASAGPLPEVVLESRVPGLDAQATLAIAVPLLPGKTAEWRRFAEEVKGTRRGEMEDFHRRVGLTTENWYLQQTPQGDMAIVYLEGAIPSCFQALVTSDHPFDRWLKQVWLETEGIDFNQPLPGPPPEVVYEPTSRSHVRGVGGI